MQAQTKMLGIELLFLCVDDADHGEPRMCAYHDILHQNCLCGLIKMNSTNVLDFLI